MASCNLRNFGESPWISQNPTFLRSLTDFACCGFHFSVFLFWTTDFINVKQQHARQGDESIVLPEGIY